MKSHEVRIEQLERILQPNERVEVEEITLVRQTEEEQPQEIQVPYLKISNVDRDGRSIVDVYIPKNGRDDPDQANNLSSSGE